MLESTHVPGQGIVKIVKSVKNVKCQKWKFFKIVKSKQVSLLENYKYFTLRICCVPSLVYLNVPVKGVFSKCIFRGRRSWWQASVNSLWTQTINWKMYILQVCIFHIKYPKFIVQGNFVRRGSSWWQIGRPPVNFLKTQTINRVINFSRCISKCRLSPSWLIL